MFYGLLPNCTECIIARILLIILVTILCFYFYKYVQKKELEFKSRNIPAPLYQIFKIAKLTLFALYITVFLGLLFTTPSYFCLKSNEPMYYPNCTDSSATQLADALAAQGWCYIIVPTALIAENRLKYLEQNFIGFPQLM